MKHSISIIFLLQVVTIFSEKDLLISEDDIGVTKLGTPCRIVRAFTQKNETITGHLYTVDLQVTDDFVKRNLKSANTSTSNETNQIECYLQLDTESYELQKFERNDTFFDFYLESMLFKSRNENDECSFYTLKRMCSFGRDNLVKCATDVLCNGQEKEKSETWSSWLIITWIACVIVIIACIIVFVKLMRHMDKYITGLERKVAESTRTETEKLNDLEKNDLAEILKNCV